ncbi:hypothetical protein [Aquibacillus kalidii]|uniref:hypothetical protein n=1 Tax=Aquibacillus kalidii TaxID=2762597 RepID=UPI0016492A72|nr:hypothetical protein [Aquibacillus kalidii]
MERVYDLDDKSYFNILLDDSIRKWVCRLGLDNTKKYIQFNDKDRTTYNIEKVSDLMKYKGKMIEVAESFDLVAN